MKFDLKSLKSLVVEDDTSSTPPSAATVTQVPSAPVVPSPTTNFQSLDLLGDFIDHTGTPIPPVESVGQTSDPMFDDHLKSISDFETTTAGQLIKKYMEALQGQPLDDKGKLTVILKLGAGDGLTKEKILSDLDSLYTNLASEADRFNTIGSAKQKTEVEGRQAKMDEIQKQVSDLQAQLTQLSADMVLAQSKITKTSNAFKAALQGRRAALDQLKARYNALLS